jgi:hypothetical protein
MLGGGCDCSATLTVKNAMSAGTYTTLGASLTEIPAVGTPATSAFCAPGGTLLITGILSDSVVYAFVKQ